MLFNQFVNVCIMIGGILEFLGIVGGIGFWIYVAVKLYQNRPLTEKEVKAMCESCQSYETCAAVMEDCLPDFACGYWKKKKP